MYNTTNHALKITLGWYYYAGNFYWTQFQSDFGYQKPSRVRLGKYTKNGSEFIRIEISNNAVYWSNYTFSATDRAELSSYYQGWTYAEGEMPAETTNQITVVGQPVSTSIEGNLGIGISNPAERLAVNGNIRAKEVKVEATGWPDYVFKSDYKLTTLAEIERNIKEKGHLPGMPSAKEVEANGIEIGDMNKRLLQKIEEFTLYLIEKDKAITILQAKNARLENEQTEIKKEMKRLLSEPKIIKTRNIMKWNLFLMQSIIFFIVGLSAKAQLGVNKGDSFEISSVSAATTSLFMQKGWLYRIADGDNWNTASLHDGISIDHTYQTPHVNTRVWWGRNPYANTQEWGDMDKTFMGIYNGKVGIGTVSPKVFLDVGAYSNDGKLSIALSRLSEGDASGEGTFLGVKGYTTNIIGGKSFALEHSFYGSVNSSVNFYRGPSITGGEISFNTDTNLERVRIDVAGNVGIGTTTPKEKLSVNGNIRAKEVKVEATGWPDYVFNKDYVLPTLAEIERNIKEKGHLPGMPSAKEVEANGVELGDMNNRLLQKIEELTLHLIAEKRASNQEIKKLNEKLIEQNRRLKSLERRSKY